MIKKSTLFRQHHFFEILQSFDSSRGPIDLFISLYFRHHPQLGSKDRLFIVERIYTYLRWKGLIEELLARENATDDRLLALLEEDLSQYCSDERLAPHTRMSFPKELYEALYRTFGEATLATCLACNEPAPMTLRVNTLKTTRQQLIEAFSAQGIVAREAPFPTAVFLEKRTNLFVLPEFKAGHFEVQDMGSQVVASYVQAQPGESVLDYCAGSGGKTLAIAPSLNHRGQLYVHDIRTEALIEAKKRLCRAGIQNVQIVDHSCARRLRLLRKRMDWVLVDAPCSGTGTLRRNPDMKWKFSQEMLDRVVAEQRQIVAEAVSYLKPSGTLVYATCSLLKEENEEQVEFFKDYLHLHAMAPPFRSTPSHGGMDGFFAVSLRKGE